jgi:hypothetical protein
LDDQQHAGRAAGALTAAGPNPARGAVRLEYALPREAAVRLEVLDAQGRVVARLADGVAAAGRYAAAWDAGAGARIAPGLYFARFQAGGVTQQRRIVVLR